MGNFITSLGFSQLVCDPTRVTDTTSTLIDHIYTNLDENISRVHVCKVSITCSDHYAVFGNRKLNNFVKSNSIIIPIRLSHTDLLRTLMKANLSLICVKYHGKQLSILKKSMKLLKFGIRCF